MRPRSVWLVLMVALAFWVYYDRIMVAEQEYLRLFSAVLSIATVCWLVLRTLERHGGLRRAAGR